MDSWMDRAKIESNLKKVDSKEITEALQRIRTEVAKELREERLNKQWFWEDLNE